MIYEYFLTLSQEVHCIWGRKLSIPTVLFYINRYGLFAHQALIILQSNAWHATAGPEGQAFHFHHSLRCLTRQGLRCTRSTHLLIALMLLLYLVIGRTSSRKPFKTLHRLIRYKYSMPCKCMPSGSSIDVFSCSSFV